MKRFPRLLTRLCLALLFLCSSTWLAVSVAAPARDDPAVVEAIPASLQVEPDEEFYIDFYITGAQSLYGIDLRIHFDPAILEVIDADPYQDGIQLIQGEIPAPDFVMYDTADNATGNIKYVVTQLNPTPPASGEGGIVSVSFHARAVGRSPITIEKVTLADAAGNKLLVQSLNGEVIVGSVDEPEPTQAPLPTATATRAAAAATPTTPATAATPSATPAATNTVAAASPTGAPPTQTPVLTATRISTQPASPLATATPALPAGGGIGRTPLPSPTLAGGAGQATAIATALATATRPRPTASPTAVSGERGDNGNGGIPAVLPGRPLTPAAGAGRVGPAVSSSAPAAAGGGPAAALDVVIGGMMMLAGVFVFVGYFVIWPRLQKP